MNWNPCETCGGWLCIAEWFIVIFGIILPAIAATGLMVVLALDMWGKL